MIRYSKPCIPVVVDTKPPETYEYLTSYVASNTFVSPKSDWYTIYMWGASSNGANGGGGRTSSKSYGGTGGTGGATGGFCAHVVRLKKGEALNILITAEDTKILNADFAPILTATAGVVGTPGTATGGNIANLDGAKGGVGGGGGYDAHGTGGSYYPSKGSAGANNGAVGGTATSSYLAGGGGGGGARAVGESYCKYVAANMTAYKGGSTNAKGSDMPAITPGPNILITGAGSGGGGGTAPKSSGTTSGAVGGTGQTGAVIIESGVKKG